jgi:16S rRNA processing protein RimM
LGSSPQEPDDSVIVARVIGPHGRDGGLNVQLLSDLPGRFDPQRELLLDRHPYSIAASRQTGPDAALIWLEGISTRRQAASFTGKYLSASPEDEAALEEGEYFHYQLIGLQVRTEEGEALGELQEILETGSNDVYIVRGEDGEVLIPAMAQVVLEVNVAGGSMTVRLPGGLR